MAHQKAFNTEATEKINIWRYESDITCADQIRLALAVLRVLRVSVVQDVILET